MPTTAIVSTFDDMSTGLLLIGASALVLSMAAGGLALMFSWFDSHAGGLIKRILLSVMAGAAIMGGSGAIGKWLAAKFALGTGTGVPATQAAELFNHTHTLVASIAFHAPSFLG